MECVRMFLGQIGLFSGKSEILQKVKTPEGGPP
jgi:hypothetical protein